MINFYSYFLGIYKYGRLGYYKGQLLAQAVHNSNQEPSSSNNSSYWRDVTLKLLNNSQTPTCYVPIRDALTALKKGHLKVATKLYAAEEFSDRANNLIKSLLDTLPCNEKQIAQLTVANHLLDTISLISLIHHLKRDGHIAEIKNRILESISNGDAPEIMLHPSIIVQLLDELLTNLNSKQQVLEILPYFQKVVPIRNLAINPQDKNKYKIIQNLSFYFPNDIVKDKHGHINVPMTLGVSENCWKEKDFTICEDISSPDNPIHQTTMYLYKNIIDISSSYTKIHPRLLQLLNEQTSYNKLQHSKRQDDVSDDTNYLDSHISDQKSCANDPTNLITTINKLDQIHPEGSAKKSVDRKESKVFIDSQTSLSSIPELEQSRDNLNTSPNANLDYQKSKDHKSLAHHTHAAQRKLLNQDNKFFNLPYFGMKKNIITDLYTSYFSSASFESVKTSDSSTRESEKDSVTLSSQQDASIATIQSHIIPHLERLDASSMDEFDDGGSTNHDIGSEHGTFTVIGENTKCS